jgi:hypothetical protein
MSAYEELVERCVQEACETACRAEIIRNAYPLGTSPFDITGGSDSAPLYRWQRHISEQRPIVCAVLTEVLCTLETWADENSREYHRGPFLTALYASPLNPPQK